MSMKVMIEQRLQAAFSPSPLDVVDDSYRHRNHAAMKGLEEAGETHFNVKIVSEVFAGKSRVQMHQMVYAVLEEPLTTGVHALAIDAKAA